VCRALDINMAAASDRKLRRHLSLLGLLALALGGIIGSGWLFAVSGAAAVVGPGAYIAWIIGGILVLFIALTWAELAAMMPRSGAIVRYPIYSHGSYTGFIQGWSYFLSAVTVPAIEAIAVVSYLGTFLTTYHVNLPLTTTGTFLGATVTILNGTGIGIAALLMVIFFIANFFGIRALATANTPVTIWKIVIPTITFIVLFSLFSSGNFSIAGGANLKGGLLPYGTSALFLAIPTTGIVFAYLGFRQALEYGGEAKNPQHDIPRATIYAVLIALVIYTFLQVAFIGSVKWPAGVGHGDWAALAGTAYGSAPLYTAVKAGAGAFFAGWAVILLLDAIVSPTGTGWVYMGTSTRTLYGLSAEGFLPRGLHSIQERFRIPWIALVFSLVIGIVFIAPLPSWYELVGFISSATVFTYVMGGLGVPVFRKTAAALHRPFKLPLMWILSGVGFVAAAMITYWSGFTVLTWVYTAIAAGLGLYLVFVAPTKHGIPRGEAIAVAVVSWIALIFLALFGPLYNASNGISNAIGVGTLFGVSGNNGIWSRTSAGPIALYFALFAIIVIGITAYLYIRTKPESRIHIRAGLWLPVWMVVFYLLSYLGAFGPTWAGNKYPGSVSIAFPYDTVIALVVASLVFVWGVFSGFETEEIKAIVAEGGVVPAEDVPADTIVPAPEPPTTTV
jgi:amino acid transporter